MNVSETVRKKQFQYVLLGVLMLGSCIYIYQEVFGGGGTTTAPVQTASATDGTASELPSTEVAVAAGPAAKKVGTTSAGLDPTLRMDAMLVSEGVVYSGTGRNIFSQNSAPVMPIPNAIARARPTPGPYVAPQPVGSPPPPPIDLKFFGVETKGNGIHVALLLHGDSVLIASAGDVVVRRYKVIEVNAKSIQVEDLENNNRQTLMLLVN
jgi:hypothetical protein